MTLIDRRNEWYSKHGVDKLRAHWDSKESERLSNDPPPDAAYRAQIAADNPVRGGVSQ